MGSMRMAVSTRLFTPTAPSAEERARLLMTVAHMPIWSPLTRSKPLPAPESPRKMLPPPMTMPISMPMAWASLICAAYSLRRFVSMPCPCSPIRLSPLSFKRIRLNFIRICSCMVDCRRRVAPASRCKCSTLSEEYKAFACFSGRAALNSSHRFGRTGRILYICR